MMLSNTNARPCFFLEEKRKGGAVAMVTQQVTMVTLTFAARVSPDRGTFLCVARRRLVVTYTGRARGQVGFR